MTIPNPHLPRKKMNEFHNCGTYGKYVVVNQKTGVFHDAVIGGMIGEKSDYLRIDDGDCNQDHLEVLETKQMPNGTRDIVAIIEGDFIITVT